jgi:hypothetical protein
MADAGVSQFIFHIEATQNPGDLIAKVRAAGMKVCQGELPSPHDEFNPFPQFLGLAWLGSVFLAAVSHLPGVLSKILTVRWGS